MQWRPRKTETKAAYNRQVKRHKLQIFYEILVAILNALDDNVTVVKPTNLQHSSRLSYDKMVKHLSELEKRRMIIYRGKGRLISVTDKGKLFIRQYDALINLLETTKNPLS